MHHVIIGAGPAGVTAAETIRKHRGGDRITLLGDEDAPPYSRMAIPYYLEGDIAETGTYLRAAAGHYDDLGIDLRQARVGSLDAGAKILKLDGGDELAFDRLLIATGASPIRPPIEGLDLAGVQTCWTLADAREIAKRAEKGASVVLVGAGFIGSIILQALVAKGVQLTVVEMGDRMVPRMLDEAAGTMLKRWCEAKGVRVLTGTTVKAIAKPEAAKPAAPQPEPGFFARLFGQRPPEPAAPPAPVDETLKVTLDNGETMAAKLVVIAAGVRPNIGFLQASGLELGAGVSVDDHLRASAPDIYAAGDVAEARDLSSGQFDVLAIQPVAVEHGHIAALNMAGNPTPHRGSLNMNVLDTIGLVSSSFGSWMGIEGGDRGQLLDEAGWRYLRLEFDGDRLIGGQAVGLTEHVGMMRGLIQTGLRLGAWKDRLIKAPERLTEAYVATAQGIK